MQSQNDTLLYIQMKHHTSPLLSKETLRCHTASGGGNWPTGSKPIITLLNNTVFWSSVNTRSMIFFSAVKRHKIVKTFLNASSQRNAIMQNDMFHTYSHSPRFDRSSLHSAHISIFYVLKRMHKAMFDHCKRHGHRTYRSLLIKLHTINNVSKAPKCFDLPNQNRNNISCACSH